MIDLMGSAAVLARGIYTKPMVRAVMVSNSHEKRARERERNRRDLEKIHFQP